MPQPATTPQRLRWHLEHVKECGCREIPKPVLDEILTRFETPDETRQMIKGRFDVANIEGITIGKATYEPGWKWSDHVGPALGQSRCGVEHLGVVVTGSAAVGYEDHVDILKPGQRFYVPPTPHDSWVVGNDEYVSLHFVGADRYSK